MTSLNDTPAAVQTALDHLYGLGQLLQGFNPDHAHTAAAPSPQVLASLVFAAHADMTAAVAEELAPAS